MDNVRSSNAPAGIQPPLPEKPNFNYAIERKPANEECRFCHILAQNDGSPKGVFFPRYQEYYGQYRMSEMNTLFHADHFKRKPAAAARELGLPDMGEDFLYQKVNPGASDADTRFTRTLIELPQIIEVMARDNKQSICVATEFGGASPPPPHATNNYVCADNAAQRLMVKLTNTVIATYKGSKEYSEPYFEKY
jgi:hypothetical protein